MTKRHFQAAAEQVKAILSGAWSDEPCSWVNAARYDVPFNYPSYVRAVWTAEAYILLFSRFNPLFNQQTFLVACGLLEAPAKRTRRTC